MTSLSRGQVLAGDDDSVFCDDVAGVYALAEGIGPEGGRRAAARVFCEVAAVYRRALSEPLERSGNDADARRAAVVAVQRVFDRAAEQIYRLAQRRAGYGGMAATAALLVVGKGGAVLGHIGDTRAWLLTDDCVQRLTQDHTVDMQSAGLLRRDDQAFTPRAVLNRAIGHAPSARADILWLDVEPGDSVPLCTAGMHRWVDDAALARLVRAGARRTGQGAGLLVEVGGADGPDTITTAGKIDLIRGMALFRYLSDPELVRLLRIVFEVRLDAGEPLCHQGAPGDAVWVLYSGRLEVSTDGHHLTFVEPGGHLGELAFMDGKPRSATVVAVAPSIALAINRDDFRTLIQHDPVLTAKVMWSFALNLGNRLRGLTIQVSDAL